MPFNTTQDLANGPLVRIFFSGQLILSPASTQSAGQPNAEIFINRKANNHDFSVIAVQKRPGMRDVILMRHFGPLQPIGPFAGEIGNPHGMLIGVAPGGIAPGSSPRGVKVYDGTVSNEGTQLSNALSLLNLHPGADVKTDKGFARPSILLNDAVLYTAERTALQFELARAGTATQQLTGFASIVGANIYPTLQQSLVMTWKNKNQIVTLPFTPPAAGTSFTYEVYVTNDPLFDPDAFAAVVSGHDELAEYYQVLPGIPQQQRFTLTMLPAVTVTAERGSPRLPCMPILGEG